MDTARPAFALVNGLVGPRSVRLTAGVSALPSCGGRRVKRLVNEPEKGNKVSLPVPVHADCRLWIVRPLGRATVAPPGRRVSSRRPALPPCSLTRVHGVEGIPPGRARHLGTPDPRALTPLVNLCPPRSGRSSRPATRYGVLLTPGALRWSPGHGTGVRYSLPTRPRPCPSSHGDAGAIPTDAGASGAANSPASPFPLIEGRRTLGQSEQSDQPTQSEGRWSIPCRTADGQPARLDVILRGARFALAALGGEVAWFTTSTGDALAHLLFQTGRLAPLTSVPCRSADGNWSVVRVAVFGDLVRLGIAHDPPVSLTGEMSQALGHLLLKVGTLASRARTADS
jgi:hypothetical protein